LHSTIKVDFGHISKLKKRLARQVDELGIVCQNISYVSHTLDNKVMARENIDYKLAQLQAKFQKLHDNLLNLADVLGKTIEEFSQIEREIAQKSKELAK